MRINAEILMLGGILCNETCPFRHSCANHCTAGDSRYEIGFTPEIFEEQGRVFCYTRKRPSLITPTGEILPDNIDSLGIGAIFIDNGELKSWAG